MKVKWCRFGWPHDHRNTNLAPHFGSRQIRHTTFPIICITLCRYHNVQCPKWFPLLCSIHWKQHSFTSTQLNNTSKNLKNWADYWQNVRGSTKQFICCLQKKKIRGSMKGCCHSNWLYFSETDVGVERLNQTALCIWGFWEYRYMACCGTLGD